MSHLNRLFRNRIGIPDNKEIAFEDLERILEKTAKTIPFENLRIINNKTTELTKDHLITKILEQNEGGLCYELNSILYLFLFENGIETNLIRGVIYDQVKQRWNTIGKTHVANLVAHDGQVYLVDTGFGGNLPLKPVPLNGETVTSANGEFRVDRIKSDHGDFIFYMKLKHKDKEWKIGYAFDSNERMKDVNALNDIQKTISDHPESPFNKKLLITKLTDNGNMVLTDTSFTQWVDGEVKKEQIDEQRFKEITKEHFGL